MRIRAQTFQQGQSSALSSLAQWDVSGTTPFPFDNTLGSYTGLANYQGCANALLYGCDPSLFSWPNFGYAIAWEDSRRTGRTVNEAYFLGGQF